MTEKDLEIWYLYHPYSEGFNGKSHFAFIERLKRELIMKYIEKTPIEKLDALFKIDDDSDRWEDWSTTDFEADGTPKWEFDGAITIEDIAGNLNKS